MQESHRVVGARISSGREFFEEVFCQPINVVIHASPPVKLAISLVQLATLKKYTSLLSEQDGISLVKPSGARSQGARRQMAGPSIRNAMSQVATLLVTQAMSKGIMKSPMIYPLDGCTRRIIC